MSGTLSEHPARILHVSSFHVHAVFCRELPLAFSRNPEMYLIIGLFLVGAVGIEPTTSPV